MSDQPQQNADEKQYSLKPAETNLLRYVKQHTEAIFAGILSTIATDRLAYHVTPNTKFELTNDFTQMKLSEVAPPPAPEQPAQTEAPQNVPGEPKPEANPVVSAPETKQAEAPAEPEAPKE